VRAMKRSVTRTKGARFCTVEVSLSDEGRLSITGSEGRIIRRTQAKKEALEYWRSFFEESPQEIFAMNQKCGTKFTSPTGAARYVLQVDGELHGLDVEGPETGETVRVVESCGQIQDTLVEFFPEIRPLLPWHLNDLRAGCEHQERLGWGRGKTIALTRDTLSPMQREVFDTKAFKECEEKREKELQRKWREMSQDQNKAIAWLKSHVEHVSGDDLATLMGGKRVAWRVDQSKRLRAFERWMREDLEKEISPEVFDAKLYPDSLGAPCPECGYAYGSAWLKRDLPPEILAKVVEFARPSAGLNEEESRPSAGSTER